MKVNLTTNCVFLAERKRCHVIGVQLSYHKKLCFKMTVGSEITANGLMGCHEVKVDE